jgi:signal transduction histidine kinase
MDHITLLAISGTLLFFLLILLISMTLHLYQRKRMFQILEISKLKTDFEQVLMTSQIEIQENTLRDISQELHDNISQQLGLVKLQLSQIQHQGEVAGINDTKAVVSRTIEDLRNLSHSMHPDRIASFSLRENLLFDLEKIKKLGNLTVEENLEPDAENLGKDKKVIIYRIVQELLNNFLKHSEASFLGIMVSYTATTINLLIEDNGRGMEAGHHAGIGLMSIKNRLGLLKGIMVMENKTEKGLKITIEVPL